MVSSVPHCVQHIATDGTPFYGIVISTILHQCLGNKSLAGKIARDLRMCVRGRAFGGVAFGGLS